MHRPRYDDWSLPKGKVDPGETLAATAVREVAEETGFACVLSTFLGQVRYPVPGATKVVDYFAARCGEGSFQPNHEVDQLRWLPLAQARECLSRTGDVGILDAFGALPADVGTVLLVRHAKAGKRSDWDGDDDLRPLSKAGWQQEKALRGWLPLFGPERVHSAPRLRCEQTVAAVAGHLGVDIVPEPLLSEPGYQQDPEAGVARLLEIASRPGTALVSSQGEVIPDLVRRLAAAAGVRPRRLSEGIPNVPDDTDMPDDTGLPDDTGTPDAAGADGRLPSRKGSVWTLTFRRGRNPDSGGDPVVLVAADYVPDPSPVTA